MNEAAPHITPLIDVSRAHHDHIGRYAQATQRAAQTDGLLTSVLDLRLDNEEVEVAAAAGIPAGVRSKQEDSCAGSGLGQPSTCLLDHGRFSHRQTVTPK